MIICIFIGGRYVVTRQSTNYDAPFPEYDEVRSLIPPSVEVRTVHADYGDLLTCQLSDEWVDTPEFVKTEFRPLFAEVEATLFAAACKAKQVAFWDAHSRFCPSCGSKTFLLTDIAKKCPACGFEIYPNISPAIIVRIERGDDELLLVHAKNFRGNHYGLVAGFVETGETLEQCVVREVREETALEITDIKYFGSQSWPFPSGLMLGFTAKYKSGDIKIQEEELTDAKFFKRGELPPVPDKMSIARMLIDDWVERR